MLASTWPACFTTCAAPVDATLTQQEHLILLCCRSISLRSFSGCRSGSSQISTPESPGMHFCNTLPSTHTTFIISINTTCFPAKRQGASCRQAAVKGCHNPTLLGLARSKQDPINRGQSICTAPRQPGPMFMGQSKMICSLL